MQELLSQKYLNSAKLEFYEFITGCVLTIFLVFHTLFLSTILFGIDLFDGISKLMEEFFIVYFAFFIVSVCLLFHVWLVFRKVSLDLKNQLILLDHFLSIKHRDSILWSAQVITGFFLFLLIPIHIWSVFTDLPIRSAKLFLKFLSFKWKLFDVFLFLTVGVHAGLGVYRIGIKWGFIKNRKRSLILILLCLLVYFLIEVLNLYFFSTK